MTIDHNFLDGCDDDGRWARWLKQAEKITGFQLERLDTRDPLRRKVLPGSWQEQGEFITSFQAHSSSRWVFGRFADPRVSVRIVLYRDKPDFSNHVSWTIEPDAFPKDAFADTVARLFDAGNRALRPFYAVADTEENFATKVKAGGYGIDYQAELSGIFWLTYFNKKYCEYFGREKFAAIQEADFQPQGGVRIRIGMSPLRYPHARRLQIERKLGAASFIDPKSRREKKRGEAALAFAELRQRRTKGSSKHT